MPKQKTHKGLSKRVKVTASGKLKHKHAGGGHLMSSKSAKHRRRIRTPVILTGPVAKTLRMQLAVKQPSKSKIKNKDAE